MEINFDVISDMISCDFEKKIENRNNIRKLRGSSKVMELENAFKLMESNLKRIKNNVFLLYDNMYQGLGFYCGHERGGVEYLIGCGYRIEDIAITGGSPDIITVNDYKMWEVKSFPYRRYRTDKKSKITFTETQFYTLDDSVAVIIFDKFEMSLENVVMFKDILNNNVKISFSIYDSKQSKDIRREKEKSHRERMQWLNDKGYKSVSEYMKDKNYKNPKKYMDEWAVEERYKNIDEYREKKYK